MNKLTEKNMVLVNKIPYKPFWMEQHMYFVNIYTGYLYSITPIYLGEDKSADISQLRNYFKENDICIVDSKSIIKSI